MAMNWKFCTINTRINGREIKYDLETGEIFSKNYSFKERPWEVKPPFEGGGYLRMAVGGKQYLHHRIIYKIYNPNWKIDNSLLGNSIDHINGTTTDNRIENLRNLTHQKNHFNRPTAKGCYFVKSTNKWEAKIMLNGKSKYLGSYDLKADARNAYLKAKKIYHII